MNFYDRLKQVLELKGFKNLRTFAIDGLGYRSYEKLNRLKDGTKKPGYQILLDISNKFENINLNWLITGKGEILLTNSNQQQPTVLPTGDLEKDLVAKFANISTRDIAFYTHLRLKIMQEDEMFNALIENLATKRALELLKEKL